LYDLVGYFTSSEPENDDSSDEDFHCPISKPVSGRRGRNTLPVRHSVRRSAGAVCDHSSPSLDDNFSDYERSTSKSPSKRKLSSPSKQAKATTLKKPSWAKKRTKKSRKVSSESASSGNAKSARGRSPSKTSEPRPPPGEPATKVRRKIRRKWKKVYNFPVKTKKRVDRSAASNASKRTSVSASDQKSKRTKDKVSASVDEKASKTVELVESKADVKRHVRRAKIVQKSLSADDANGKVRKTSRNTTDILNSPPLKPCDTSPTLMDLYRGKKVVSVPSVSSCADDAKSPVRGSRATEANLFGDELTEKEAEVLSHALENDASQQLPAEGIVAKRDQKQQQPDSATGAQAHCAGSQVTIAPPKKKRGRKPKALKEPVNNGMHRLENLLYKKKKLSDEVPNLAAGTLPKHIRKLKGKNVGKPADGKIKVR